MSTISAGTTTTTALVQTGDTTGSLVLQTGSTPTTAMTISSSQIVNFANAPTVAGAALPSGAITLISTLTASSSASLAWTGLSGYDKYLLIFENFKFSHNYLSLCCQLGTGSSPTYATSGYTFIAYDNNYNGSSANLTTSTYSAPSSFNSTIYISDSNITGSAANGISSGTILFSGFTSGSYQTYSTNCFGQDSGNNTVCNSAGSGMLNQTTNITAIKLYGAYPSGYLITSGTASLYGISS